MDVLHNDEYIIIRNVTTRLYVYRSQLQAPMPAARHTRMQRRR